MRRGSGEIRGVDQDYASGAEETGDGEGGGGESRDREEGTSDHQERSTSCGEGHRLSGRFRSVDFVKPSLCYIQRETSMMSDWKIHHVLMLPKWQVWHDTETHMDMLEMGGRWAVEADREDATEYSSTSERKSWRERGRASTPGRCRSGKRNVNEKQVGHSAGEVKVWEALADGEKHLHDVDGFSESVNEERRSELGRTEVALRIGFGGS